MTINIAVAGKGGNRLEIVNLVHNIMDGESVNIASLPEEMANHAKTARVLKGDSLFSHAWL